MNKYLVAASAILSVLCVVLAWEFVIELEPASPLLPFMLVFIGGIAFRQSID